MTIESNLKTSSADYSEYYYSHCCGENYVRNDKWLGFFRAMAGCFRRDFPGAVKVLDAGCAKGFLVEALMDQGFDVQGIDISEYAIANAYEAIKSRMRVGSLVQPLAQRYDLIVSIEVIEHMNRQDALAAIANFCAHSDDIVISSSPFDYDEPTHINVNPPSYWAEAFARHGFFHDVDFDATFVTPWAMRFRKRPGVTVPEIVRDYSRKLWELQQSAAGARRYAANIQERCQQLEQSTGELEKLKHQLQEREKDLAEAKSAVLSLQNVVSSLENEQKMLAQDALIAKRDAEYSSNALIELKNGRWYRLRRQLDPLIRLFQ